MGFCILGLVGSCDSKQKSESRVTTQRQNFTDMMNSQVNKMMTNIAATATNNIDIHIKGHGAIISDSSFSQTASVDFDVQGTISEQLSSNEFLDNTVDWLTKNALDAKFEDKGGVSTDYQLTDAETTVMDTVRTSITNDVDNEEITQIVSDASNDMSYTLDGGDDIAGIVNSHFDQAATNISKEIIEKYYNAIQNVSLSQDVVDQLDQESQADIDKSGPISGFFDNLSWGLLIILALLFILIFAIVYKIVKK